MRHASTKISMAAQFQRRYVEEGERKSEGSFYLTYIAFLSHHNTMLFYIPCGRCLMSVCLHLCTSFLSMEGRDPVAAGLSFYLFFPPSFLFYCCSLDIPLLPYTLSQLPFASFLIGGYDTALGAELYAVEPSGVSWVSIIYQHVALTLIQFIFPPSLMQR